MGARTFLISSKSLLNPSATEAIQNFLNRARSTASLCDGSSGDKKFGIEVAAGGGDGERSLRCVGAVEASGRTAAGTGEAALLDAVSESSDDDEESESELSGASAT